MNERVSQRTLSLRTDAAPKHHLEVTFEDKILVRTFTFLHDLELRRLARALHFISERNQFPIPLREVLRGLCVLNSLLCLRWVQERLLRTHLGTEAKLSLRPSD